MTKREKRDMAYSAWLAAHSALHADNTHANAQREREAYEALRVASIARQCELIPGYKRKR